MKRNLSLVLDKDGKMSLTLEHMEQNVLDEFTSKKFTSSEDIRKKYAKEIESYLQKNKDFIDMVEQKNKRKYAGSIVITDLQRDMTIKKIKVLYKKDIKVFEKIIKNKKFMLALENRDYINYINSLKENSGYSRIFSDYYAKELRFRSTLPNKFNHVINSWHEAIKQSDDYFEMIRRVLKEYELRYKELELDSLTVVYSKLVQEKSLAHKSKELEQELLSLDKLQNGDKFERDLLLHENDYKKNIPDLVFIDEDDLKEALKPPTVTEPKRYKTYADEEDYPGDLDDSYSHNQYSNIDYDEEIIFEKSKTKQLHSRYGE